MRSATRWLLFGALIAAYLLHNDFWLWRDARLVLGLPIGLLYHVLLALGASVLMALLVFFAWPDRLGAEDEDRTAGR